MKLKGGALQTYQKAYCPDISQGIKVSGLNKLFCRIVEVLLRGRVLLCLAGFLMGRAVLFEELTPFGPAFWAVVFTTCPYKSLYTAVGIIAGGLSYSPGWYPFRLTLSILFFTLISHYVKRSRFEIPGWGVMSFSMVLAVIPQFIFNYYLLYDLMLVIFEVMLALLAWPIFLQVVPFLKGNFPKKGLSFETSISLMLTGVMLILGVGEWSLGHIFPRTIISKFFMVTMGFLGGGGLGAATGAVLGFAGTLSGNEQYIALIGIYVLAGLLAGMFRELGKIGSAAGYLVGSLLLSFYFLDFSDLTYIFMEDALIVAAFLLIPSTAFSKLTAVYGGIKKGKEAQAKNDTAEQGERYKNLTVNRVRDFAGVFEELAASLNHEEQVSSREEDLTSLINKLAVMVCNQCGRYNRCWRKDMAKTQKIMREIFSSLEKEESSLLQASKKLGKYCSRKKELVNSANHLWELYRVNTYWQKRMTESQDIVTAQLLGISQVIKELSREMKIGDESRENYKNNPNLYITELGVAQMARTDEEVSGDYYGFYDLKEGKQAVIISDGMGCGKKALRESQAAVNLIGKLLQTGLGKESVIKTVNSLLKLRIEEAFSTVDLLLVDLKQGVGEFIKIGACSSYIKRGRTVKEVKGFSLPIGIVSEIEPSAVREKLEHNDFVIMITDGFTELRGGKAEDSWLKETIKEIKHVHPQVIADYLLEEAYQLSGGRVRDDFTVVVCRVVQLKNKINHLV